MPDATGPSTAVSGVSLSPRTKCETGRFGLEADVVEHRLAAVGNRREAQTRAALLFVVVAFLVRRRCELLLSTQKALEMLEGRPRRLQLAARRSDRLHQSHERT